MVQLAIHFLPQCPARADRPRAARAFPDVKAKNNPASMSSAVAADRMVCASSNSPQRGERDDWFADPLIRTMFVSVWLACHSCLVGTATAKYASDHQPSRYRSRNFVIARLHLVIA